MKNANNKRVFSYLLQTLLTLVLLLTVVACKKEVTPITDPEDEPEIVNVEKINDFPCSEQGAMDFVDWLLKNDLSTKQGADMLNITSGRFVNEVTRYSLFELAQKNFKPLYNSWVDEQKEGYKKYLTDKDQKICAEILEEVDYDGCGLFIYLWDELKTKIETIWGQDKIDFTSFYVYDWERGFFISENNYFVYFQYDSESDPFYPFYRIIDAQSVSVGTDRFIVKLQMIGVEPHWYVGEEDFYDDDDEGFYCGVFNYYNNISYGFIEVEKPQDFGKTTMEQLLKDLKIKDNIGVLEIEVFYTDRGMQLGGRKVTNKIVPYEKDIDWVEYTVKAKNGAHLYFGPGIDYEAIVTIANGEIVQSEGYLTKDNGWLYIFYPNRDKDISYYGWVSKEFLVPVR